MVEIVGTKHTHWSYEEEVRILWPLEGLHENGGLYFAPFSDGFILKEVFLGPTTKWGTEDIKEAIDDADVKTISTRLSFQEFKVVKQENPKLWKRRKDD